MCFPVLRVPTCRVCSCIGMYCHAVLYIRLWFLLKDCRRSTKSQPLPLHCVDIVLNATQCKSSIARNRIYLHLRFFSRDIILSWTSLQVGQAESATQAEPRKLNLSAYFIVEFCGTPSQGKLYPSPLIPLWCVSLRFGIFFTPFHWPNADNFYAESKQFQDGNFTSASNEMGT